MHAADPDHRFAGRLGGRRYARNHSVGREAPRDAVVSFGALRHATVDRVAVRDKHMPTVASSDHRYALRRLIREHAVALVHCYEDGALRAARDRPLSLAATEELALCERRSQRRVRQASDLNAIE